MSKDFFTFPPSTVREIMSIHAKPTTEQEELLKDYETIFKAIDPLEKIINQVKEMADDIYLKIVEIENARYVVLKESKKIEEMALKKMQRSALVDKVKNVFTGRSNRV